MPESFRQRVVFSVLMAFAMVYGMEVYNQALLAGALQMSHFTAPFADVLPLMCAVIVLESLVCGRVAHRLTFRLLDASSTPALLITVFMGAFTCWTMCPMMSLVATIAFKHPAPENFFAIWLQTVALNFPMALFWQLFAAGPAVRATARLLYRIPFLQDAKSC